MTVRRLILAAVPLLLAGCTVGPAYRAPTPLAGAEAPLRSIQPAAETTAAPPADWWRLYDDARLDGYLKEAFAANTELRSAEANLSAARAVLHAARAGRYPQTRVEAAGVYGRDAATDEILEIDRAKPQTIWLFDDVLDASYEFDLFGRVRRAIEASRADAEAASAARDALKVTVAAETARAYAQVCALGEELAVAGRSVETADREVKITADRHAAGANTDFEVVRAEAVAAQARAALPPLEGQRRAALFQLGALLGRPPAHAPTEALDCATPLRLKALIPIGDGAGLIRRRPDVRQAERRLAGATARVGVATADLYPRITLSAFYGGAATAIPDLATNVGLLWGAGPAVSWTFPNQAGPRARVHQAQAGAEAALAGFDSAVLQALKEAEQALSLYDAEIDHRRALGVAQAKARRAFELARGELAAGSISPLDVLVAERTVIAADAAVAASDGVLVQDQIAVFKALGGGWETP